MGRDWESLAVKSLHPYGIWIRRHRIGKNVLEDGPCNFVGRRSLCQCERKKEREGGETKVSRMDELSFSPEEIGKGNGRTMGLDAKRADISSQPCGY